MSVEFTEARLAICERCEHKQGDRCGLMPEWMSLVSVISVSRNNCPAVPPAWRAIGAQPRIDIPANVFRRWDGDQWVAVAMKGIAMGSDLYLCCPGPSLATLSKQKIRGPGRTVLAVNTAWPAVDADIWLGVDHPWCFDGALWHTGMTTICDWKYRRVELYGKPLAESPQTIFIAGSVWGEKDWVGEAMVRNDWCHNVFTKALQLALWASPSRIFLVGTDLGGDPQCHYHDGRVLPDALRERNQRLYKKEVQQLRHVAADIRSTEIVSCTPDSGANEYIPYMPLADALASSQAKAVGPDLRVHSRQTTHCKWGKWHQTTGVITGCDRKLEWILPWWYENFRKHSDARVAFCDFGMSKEMLARCALWGKVIPIDYGPDGKKWWKKPFAVLASPFRHTVWLDVDCQVVGDISALLKPGDNIGLVTDQPATKKLSRPIYNSGVITVPHGLGLISDWARACYAWTHQDWHYGDQDVLAVLIETGRWDVDTLPPEYNSLRLCPSADPVISHYTGVLGTRHIREIINGQDPDRPV